MKTTLLTVFSLMLTTMVMGQLSTPPSGWNQKSSVTQWIGLVEVTIAYSSPDVHASTGEDRKGHIWGEVVHYGFVDQGYGTSKAAPWRAGANENTTISFSHDVNINGKPLKAGTYGLFLDVEKEGPWQWIFSKDANHWGSYYYNEARDALRTKATPAATAYTEWLTYGFDGRQSSSAVAYLAWENKRIEFNIEVTGLNEMYVEKFRHELIGSTKGFTYLNYMEAAQFCAQHKVQLEQGLQWAQAAISDSFVGRKDFNSLQTKAQVLYAMSREKEADEIMQEAIKDPTATIIDLHQLGRSLVASGKKEKAMEVFQLNRKLHPKDKFTTYVGLARGFTAMGDKEGAIKNWEIAIKNIPEDQKASVGQYEAELKRLKG
ncbi:MAG: DUF2911 domain-containing protein [Chryseolinea sp.]